MKISQRQIKDLTDTKENNLQNGNVKEVIFLERFCWGVSYRQTHPHVTYTNWMNSLLHNRSLGSVSDSFLVLSLLNLSKLLPRVVIFLILKLRRGLSQLSFVYVLFAFNIFLITYFWVVSSFEPPLDHNRFSIDFIKEWNSFLSLYKF